MSELSTQQSIQGPRSTRPLLCRSGRPLSLRHIASNGRDPEEYLKSETWLWRPLQTRPLAEIIDLIYQINSLPQIETEVASAGESPHGLEDVLDIQDPNVMATEMRNVAHQLCNVLLDDPRGKRVALLGILAEYGEISPYTLTGLIDAVSKTSLFGGGDLPNLTAVLAEQLKSVYIRQIIVNKSKILRGSYRWSTTYIETLLTDATRPEYRMPNLATIRNMVENASQNYQCWPQKVCSAKSIE